MIARTPEAFADQGIRVRTGTTVLSIDPSGRTVRLKDEELPFDHLVLATGVAPRRLKVGDQDLPGIFCLRGLEDALRIKAFIRENRVRKAVIVGAGFIALEMCEAFRNLGLDTTVIYRNDLPMNRMGEPFSRRILSEMEHNRVHFMPNTDIHGFHKTAGGTLSVNTTAGDMETDLVLLAIGVLPRVTLAQDAGIVLGPTGAIAVNNRMETNLKGVYAAGDCCESHHLITKKPVHQPLGDAANKQGRTAGANIGGESLTFPGVIGSFGFKVFDLEVASTGLTEEAARKEGFEAKSSLVEAFDKPSEYPGAEKVTLRLVSDDGSGRLLGAQAMGRTGAVSRVNIMSAAITAGLSCEGLASLDMAYAPPFNQAQDPIHIAVRKLL